MEQQVLEACETLMGTRVGGYGEPVLNQLDISSVKRAFRTLAIETHPDVANRHKSIRRASDGERFIKVTRAYEVLMAYLLARKSGPGAPSVQPTAHRQRHPHRSPPSGRQAGSPPRARIVPVRRLRLAEYLYYTGRVSWESLIHAIVWQRRGRPRFGEVARRFGSMTKEDLLQVLRSQRRNERTGEAAERLRVLSPEEVRLILCCQRTLQKPIGRYFVEAGQITRAELAQCLSELRMHNARYGQRARTA